MGIGSIVTWQKTGEIEYKSALRLIICNVWNNLVLKTSSCIPGFPQICNFSDWISCALGATVVIGLHCYWICIPNFTLLYRTKACTPYPFQTNSYMKLKYLQSFEAVVKNQIILIRANPKDHHYSRRVPFSTGFGRDNARHFCWF